MVATQIRRPRQSAALPETSTRRVREMLLEIAYRLHATAVVKRLPRRDDRRPARNGLSLVS